MSHRLDYAISTVFFLFLVILFTAQVYTQPIAQFTLGLILVLILVGFFMYIFTPPIVDRGRATFSGIKKIVPPIGVGLLFAIYRLIFPVSADLIETIIQVITALVLITMPTLIYLGFPHTTDQGLTKIDVLLGLWAWMPIEFGFVDDMIGTIESGDIPFETLYLLFAFAYALIFVRNHDMGLEYATISLEDFILVMKVTGVVTLVILPLGMLTNFLAPPSVIWNNFLALVADFPSSLLNSILVFIMIFLGIALIEEIFFRGFIHNLLVKRFEPTSSMKWWYIGVGLIGALIVITPWVDDLLSFLSQAAPAIFTPIATVVGSLAQPLGAKEGQAWALVTGIPLEILYLGVAVLLALFGITIIYQTKDPFFGALVISSMLFGWAHFEDLRYIFFAAIAGFGYGYTYQKTRKIVPAALVHMTVDAVWSLILTF
ncbi:MAG: lysostaphin resistance A-like protein [Candidatus Thorarchaeota archaeon]